MTAVVRKIQGACRSVPPALHASRCDIMTLLGRAMMGAQPNATRHSMRVTERGIRVAKREEGWSKMFLYSGHLDPIFHFLLHLERCLLVELRLFDVMCCIIFVARDCAATPKSMSLLT